MALPRLHRNIKIRIITNFLSGVLGSMIWPFMAIYFSNYFGAKLTGVLLTGEVLLGIAIGFYGGYLADKVGRKKMMIIGLSLTTTGYFFMTLANSPVFQSVWITLLMFIIIGSSYGIIGPAAGAMLIDCTNDDNRPFVYSIQYWAGNLSGMIGGSLGGFFFQHHKFEIFLGLTIVAILDLLLTTKFIVEEYTVKKAVEKIHILKDIAKSYHAVIKNKAFMFFFIASALMWSSERQMTNYIAVHWAQHFKPVHISISNWFSHSVTGYNLVGLYTTENTFLVVTFGMLIAVFVKRTDMKRLFYIASTVYMLFYAFLGLLNSMVLIIIFGMVITFAEMTIVPISSTYSVSMMHEENRGSYSAFMNVGDNIKGLIASLCVSLYGIIGTYGMTIVMLLLALIAFVLFRISLRIHFNKKELLN